MQRCYLKDGRGHPPEEPDDGAVSMFLRLAVPAPAGKEMSQIKGFVLALGEETARIRPDLRRSASGFGVAGHAAEGWVGLEYEQVAAAFRW